MLKKILATTLLTMTTLVSMTAHEGTNSSDDQQIRASVSHMEKGWNDKSGVAFSEPFAEDADYVLINGKLIQGRSANAALLQKLFDTIYKHVDLKLTIENIRYLSPDVAVVGVFGESHLASDASKNYKGEMTLVMSKDNGKWEIDAYQFTTKK